MSLKILNYLFTGPFEIDYTNYRKNKRPTIFLFIEKTGTKYAPTFNAIDILKANENDINFSSYYEKNLKTNYSDKSIISIFFKEFYRNEEEKRNIIFTEIYNEIKTKKKVLMMY